MKTAAQRHKSGNAISAQFWRRRNFIVSFEVGCDVFAWTVRDGQFLCVFSEYEQSTRNVIRNAQRNHDQVVPGSKKYLTVVPSKRLAVAVRKQLRHYLTEEQSRKIAVVLLARLQQQLTSNAAS